VYDVAEYMPDHPGGSDYIETNLGKNIEEPFEDAEHTKAAKKTLLKLPVVGVMEADSNSDDAQAEGAAGSKDRVSNLFGEDFNSKHVFDYDKPLLWQIFNTDFALKDYIEYINEPKILTNPVRDIILFENTFLEMCSKSYWWMIPMFWGAYSYYQYTLYTASTAANIISIIAGIAFWTLAEYVLHRFLFHGEDNWMHHTPENKWIFTGHFMIHGIHHAFPSDRLRLVFPPIPGYILNLLIIHPFNSLFIPDPYFRPFMTGFWIVYVIYHMIHYYLHHGQALSEYFRDLKVYHMQHHYKFGHIGYGVSSKIWDAVFDTKIDVNSGKKMPDTITAH